MATPQILSQLRWNSPAAAFCARCLKRPTSEQMAARPPLAESRFQTMNTENLTPAAEHLVGFLIVMIALAVLWGMTGLMGHWFGRRDGAKSTSASTAASTDDDLVIVAAATAALIREPHRVLSVRQQSSSSSRKA